MKTKFIAMIAMIFVVTSGLKAQNQVFFPVDSIPGITIKLDGEDEGEEVTVTTPVVNKTQTQILEREWSNLESGLRKIMQSPSMLTSDVTGEIQYIYKVKHVDCYGDLYLCIALKTDGSKEYLLSRSNPLEDEIDPILAINLKACQKGNDDGSLSSPTTVGHTIPRRKGIIINKLTTNR